MNEKNKIPNLGIFKKIIKKSLLVSNSDGTFDYKGNLDFSIMNLNSLSEIPIRFRNVFGSFDCSNNNLTNLENSPLFIEGGFNVSYNNLISLFGMPKHINLSFVCFANNLISLQHISNKINGYFYCYYNNLLSDYHPLKRNKKKFDSDPNPFSINNEVINTVKMMTHEQQMAELDFFKEHDQKAFEMMKEVLDNLGLGYGEGTRKMVGVLNKDYTSAKNLF